MNQVGRNCHLSESLQELAACGFGLPLAELVEGYGEKASKRDAERTGDGSGRLQAQGCRAAS